VLIKATKVDGVYDADPKKNPEAKMFEHMTHLEFLSRRLTVMDSTAVTLSMENKMPILVLNFWDNHALLAALRGETIGTLVHV
jgi:uridylate kinase